MTAQGSDVKQEKQVLRSIIGNNINMYRIKNGYSQDVLAEKVGISPSYVTRIENGQKFVSVYVLLKIAKVLHVSCDTLLSSQPLSSTEGISQLLAGCSNEFIDKTERVIRI